ncbi:MAG: alpha/beta hydrolase [Chryseolinea sp.]
MALGIARTLKAAFLLTVLAIAISFHSCMSFRMSSREVDEFFKSQNVEAKQKEYTTDNHQIHYVSAGDSTGPLVLFVHGSPGSLSAFIRYLADTSLLAKGLLVTTDRPGFGYSNFGHGVASLSAQASILKPLLVQHKQNRPVILIGHSLGGPLIARMAMDYPELIDGLIIVAGSIDPELEPNEVWFRAPLATPFLSWLLPRSLRASNEEIYHLKPELEKMLPHWSDIRCPVIVIQGRKDSLVPAENAEFARKQLVNAPVEFVFKDDMDHFVPWSNPELIHDAIIRMITQTLPAAHAASSEPK